MLRLPGPAVRRPSFAFLAAAVLCLAAFNLCFRLHVETVHEWDESLYATTAWEMLQHGSWIGTTFHGSLDYYNTKPPLNFWLIALSFKLFGVNLVALRLPSILAAYATVALIMLWGKRHLGDVTGLLAGLVLSTLFAFLYTHAGRSANTDAIYTLLIVLTVVVLWAARQHPWRLVWIGLLLAAVFLLRGFAVLLPLIIVVVDELVSFGIRRRGRWLPTVTAAVAFAAPVTAWIVARWRVDEWRFLERVFWYDFFARSVGAIEKHEGSVFYYFGILQRHHYDWLIAAVIAWLLFPVHWRAIVAAARGRRNGVKPVSLLLVWAVVALAVPTMMQTKLQWYLNPFYPVFALGVGAIFAQGCRRVADSPGRWRSRRARVLASVLVLAACVAQGRLFWYSYHHHDLSTSSQGLLLAERDLLAGRTVFSNRFDRANIFITTALIGAEHRLVADVDQFLRDSRQGDLLLSSKPQQDAAIELVKQLDGHYLYQRVK